MAHLSFTTPVPWWGGLLIAFVIGVIAALAYARSAVPRPRRDALIGLRFITLAALILFLMGPVRVTDEGLRNAFVPVLVDVSRSMSIDDADGQRRIDRARDLLTRQLLPALNGQFRVEVLSFGERLRDSRPADLAATDRASDLSGAMTAVRDRYRGRPVAGIVLISDGGDTSPPQTDQPIQPVFALGVGSKTVGRDREVSSVTAAEAIADDSRIDLAVTAVSHGNGAEPIALQLLENGKPIEVRRIAPAADGVPVHTVFQVSPVKGTSVVYSVEVPLIAGELVPENNTRSVLVQAPSRQRHVLFVEGAPGFEHSFLKRAWAADQGLDVDSIVRKGKNEQGADTYYIQAAQSRSNALASGFPPRAEELFAYDAVVLANVESSQLTRDQQELLRAFVGQRGGGILVLGAKSFVKPGLADTPLEEVLPLQLTQQAADTVLPASSARGTNRVSLTETGESHPVMQLGAALDETRKRWDAAPALASTALLGGPRPGASVLAVTGGAGGGARALVAVQRYGEGRSMIFTGEGAWRWRMLLPSTDRSYDTFWRQALRWLAVPATDPVAIRLPAAGSPGDTLSVKVVVRDAAFEPQAGAAIETQLTSPSGRTESIQMSPSHEAEAGDGVYSGRFRADAPGIYRIRAEARNGSSTFGTAGGAMLVGGSDPEMADPRLNQQVLQRLAVRSGGRLIAATDVAAVADQLKAAVPGARLAVTHELWHTGWSFALILSLLVAEWLLRRRWGLR